MEDKTIEPFYQKRAKEVVDAFYDKRFLADDLSRSDLQSVENVLAHYFQSLCESAVTMAELCKRGRTNKIDPNEGKP